MKKIISFVMALALCACMAVVSASAKGLSINPTKKVPAQVQILNTAPAKKVPAKKAPAKKAPAKKAAPKQGKPAPQQNHKNVPVKK